MKIGIYGGTFSPPHNGHLRAAKLFLDTYSFDKLIIMPAGIPPHKSAPTDITPDIRFEMCKRAFSSISEKVEVSRFEIDKKARSYTVETVEHFLGEGSITVLCGEDMILSLDTWFRAEELMKMCSFAAIIRHPGARERVADKIKELEKSYGASIDLIDVCALEVSSTQIRERISNNEDISELVPEEVLTVIKKYDLYR